MWTVSPRPLDPLDDRFLQEYVHPADRYVGPDPAHEHLTCQRRTFGAGQFAVIARVEGAQVLGGIELGQSKASDLVAHLLAHPGQRSPCALGGRIHLADESSERVVRVV